MPFHARFAEAMRGAGLWDDFELLKRKLVTLAAQPGAIAPGSQVVVWDFSGYNDLTMDAIRGAGSDSRWFEDSIHPSIATGDRMLARMFDAVPEGQEPRSDFGHQLNPANVEEVLAASTRRRDEYLRLHPADVAEVQKLVAETATYRAAAPAAF